MNLYLLERTDPIGADEAVAFVVAAPNPIAALGLTVGQWDTSWSGWWQGYTQARTFAWEEPLPMTQWPVTVKLLGEHTAEGVVLRDYSGC